MTIKENKIKLLNKKYDYLNKLLNICNKIEYNLNYLINFNYDKYNLLNIHGLLENTFNHKMYNTFYNLKDNINNIENIKQFDIKFKYVYRIFRKYHKSI